MSLTITGRVREDLDMDFVLVLRELSYRRLGKIGHCISHGK